MCLNLTPHDSRNLVIVDTGLLSYLGHHYMFDRKLVVAGEARNYRCTIYGNSKCTNLSGMLGAVIRPHFRAGPYPELNAVPLTADAWRHLNQVFARDLERCKLDSLGENDLLIFHTVRSSQLLGLATWLEAAASSLKARVIIYLLCAECEMEDGLQQAFLKDGLHALCKIERPTVEVFAETEHIRDYLRSRSDYKLNIDIGPMVGTEADLVREIRPINGPIRVGYLGHSKRRKGLHLLPEVVATAVSSGIEMTFTIQIVAPRWDKDDLISISQKLRENPVARIIERPLSGLEYEEEFLLCDIILLPYSPEYAHSGSAILTEAVATGRLLVLPEYCGFHSVLNSCGAPGFYFTEWNPASVSVCLIEAARKYNILTQDLLVSSRTFREMRGVQMLFHGGV